jgi:hypothetical protein
LWRRFFDRLVRLVRFVFRPAASPVGRGPGTGKASRRGPTSIADILDSSGELPVIPQTAGEAPQRPLNLLGIDFEASADPRIQKLRRAAVVQIFELTGLGIVPGQFWQFLAEVHAPGDAVIRFLWSLGVDPDLVRRGDRDELERANEVLDLLVDIDGAFERLSVEARADVRSAIYCGEYERVRETAQIVRTYLSILDLGHSYPDDQRFPAFTEFLRDIASELDNPLTASASDAAAADRIRLRMSDLLRQLTDRKIEHDRLVNGLWSDFPDWHSSPLEPELTLGLSRFYATLESIHRRPNSTDEVSELLTHLDAINAELRALLRKLAAGAGDKSSYRRGSRDSSGGAYAKAAPTLLEQAFKYFGIDKLHLPSASDFKRIKRGFQRKTHPDTGGSHERFLEFTHHCRLVEDYLATA